MKEWTEDEIEQFIRDNRDRFNIATVTNRHEDKFLVKLSKRFKKIVSIIPHLVKVAIVTIIIFIISIWAWNSYIRKDRHEITLKQKIENIVTFKK
jgi:hypothetical protein